MDFAAQTTTAHDAPIAAYFATHWGLTEHDRAVMKRASEWPAGTELDRTNQDHFNYLMALTRALRRVYPDPNQIAMFTAMKATMTPGESEQIRTDKGLYLIEKDNPRLFVWYPPGTRLE